MAENANKGGNGDPCNTLTAGTGCKVEHKCGKMKSQDTSQQKIYDEAGEICFHQDQCDQEQVGQKTETILKCGSMMSFKVQYVSILASILAVMMVY